MLNLFCFASRTHENIQRGFEARRWAVATTSEQDQRTRKTKINRKVKVGDLGLLYCNPFSSFMVPFVFQSVPDITKIDTETWQQPWIFPFSIDPLCGVERLVSAGEAEERWGVTKRRFKEMGGRQGGISAAMHLTGTTAFSPLQISNHDWIEILNDFGIVFP